MCLNRSILLKKQAGIGLPATVFLITILAAIVVAMSDLTEQSSLGFGQNYHSMQAFYAAESGAQVAVNRVLVGGAAACVDPMAPIDFDAGGDNPGLNNCEAVLACTKDSVATIEYYTITSTATCGSGFEQSQRSVQVRAKL